MTTLKELQARVEKHCEEDAVCVKMNNAKGDFLKVHSSKADPFLLDQPPAYNLLTICDGKDRKEQEVVSELWTFNRLRLLKTDTFPMEMWEKNYLENEIHKYRACHGYKTDRPPTLTCPLSESKLCKRSPNCLYAFIGQSGGDLQCPHCSSVRVKRPKQRPKATCSDCDVVFKSEDLLKQHLRRKHDCGKKKVWPCPRCDRPFARSDGLQAHIKAVHGEQKAFQCSDCGTTFSSQSHLVEHSRRSHVQPPSKAKSWPCVDCQKAFFCRQQLERHRRVHTGERPFSCTVCARRFNRSHHLNTHLNRVHRVPTGDLEATVEDPASRNNAKEENEVLQFSIVHKGDTQIINVVPI